MLIWSLSNWFVGSNKRGHSHWWRDITKLYHQSDPNIFNQHLTWKVGSGERIKFWTDKWLGTDYTLEQKYNQLFRISRQQSSLISSMGNFNNDSWEWDLRWRRNLFDHENDIAVQFMEEISSIPIQRHSKDSMVWLAEPHGHYTTKSAYKFYTKPSTSNSDGKIYSIIWKLKIPPRVAVFCWRLLKNRLPTKDNLLRRNITIQDQNCPLCGNAQEDVGHLFFNCNLTKCLWCLVPLVSDEQCCFMFVRVHYVAFFDSIYWDFNLSFCGFGTSLWRRRSCSLILHSGRNKHKLYF